MVVTQFILSNTMFGVSSTEKRNAIFSAFIDVSYKVVSSWTWLSNYGQIYSYILLSTICSILIKITPPCLWLFCSSQHAQLLPLLKWADSSTFQWYHKTWLIVGIKWCNKAPRNLIMTLFSSKKMAKNTKKLSKYWSKDENLELTFEISVWIFLSRNMLNI